MTTSIRATTPLGRSPLVLRLLLAVLGGAVFALALEFGPLGALSWVALAPLLALQRRLAWFPAGLATAAVFLPVYLLIGRPYVEISPVLVILGPSLLAILYGLGGAACALLQRYGRWSPAAVAGVWVLIEAVKGRCGLEFGSAGYTQWAFGPVRGLASLVGAIGVSWAVWYTNALVAEAAAAWGRTGGRRRLRPAAWAFPLALVLVAATNRLLPAWGDDAGVRIDVVAAPRHDTTAERRRARLDPGYRRAVLDELFRASTAKVAAPATDRSPRLVVWPETAAQLYPEADGWLQELVAASGLGGDVTLLAGAFGGAAAPPVLGFNSVFAFDAVAGIRGRYDKHRLIPFDEYQPLRAVSSLLFDREVLTEFHVGAAPEPLELPWGRVGVSICYEETFAEGFRRQTAAGADLLVTCANYSYFASPLAPRFMHALATFRAAECGRWLVRVCNRGPVELVDPRGDTHLSRPFEHPSGSADALVVSTQVPLRSGLTPYVAAGHRLVPLGVLLCLVWTLFPRRARVHTP